MKFISVFFCLFLSTYSMQYDSNIISFEQQELSTELYRKDAISFDSNLLCVNIKKNDGNGANPNLFDGKERNEIKSILNSKWSRDLTIMNNIEYQIKFFLTHPFTAYTKRWFHIFQLKFEKSKISTPLLTIGFKLGKIGFYIKSNKYASQIFHPLENIKTNTWYASSIVLKKINNTFTVIAMLNNHRLTFNNIIPWGKFLRIKFGLYRKKFFQEGYNKVCFSIVKIL